MMIGREDNKQYLPRHCPAECPTYAYWYWQLIRNTDRPYLDDVNSRQYAETLHHEPTDVFMTVEDIAVAYSASGLRVRAATGRVAGSIASEKEGNPVEKGRSAGASS